MKKTMRSLLSASLVMVGGVCINAQAALPAGLSGGWFNPQASGHGLSVQILDPERALMFWYVYDHEGKPMPLPYTVRLPSGLKNHLPAP